MNPKLFEKTHCIDKSMLSLVVLEQCFSVTPTCINLTSTSLTPDQPLATPLLTPQPKSEKIWAKIKTIVYLYILSPKGKKTTTDVLVLSLCPVGTACLMDTCSIVNLSPVLFSSKRWNAMGPMMTQREIVYLKLMECKGKLSLPCRGLPRVEDERVKVAFVCRSLANTRGREIS